MCIRARVRLFASVAARHEETRRHDVIAPAHGTLAGAPEPIPLLEHEAALVASRRLDDEALSPRLRRSFQVLEVPNDFAFGHAGARREFVSGERSVRECVSQRLTCGRRSGRDGAGHATLASRGNVGGERSRPEAGDQS